MNKWFLSLLTAVTLAGLSQAQDKSKEWFPFHAENYYAESALDLSHWLDAPAGKHGFATGKGKDIVFEDNTPVKFWGTNLCSNLPFMEADQAKIWARFLAKYGFNAVRFHKFTWNATDGIHSTVITPERWNNFDFLCKQLRDKGIYYGWSHIYGHRIGQADSSRVVAYTELANTNFPWSHLNGTTSALVNFAEDLQTLNIELTVNMLNHRNPYTGIRYAEDPALNFIELQNEDNIFWSAIEKTLEQTPAYRKLLCQKFSAWLKQKYHTQENLVNAWNHEGLPPGETLEAGNIYPRPSHGFFSAEYEQAFKNGQPVKQHVTDKANFLLEEQVKFYNRFVKAIRETGYRGIIVGSCWQAGTGISHLYNLYADYQTGMIDRHNYFGGGEGHQMKPGKFSNEAMVSSIGSGLYGTGLQQISDRPFSFSEWMSLIPNEWTAESAPLIATYGLGLQGWDASYVFATDRPFFSETIQMPGGGIYNATSPTQLGVYPALAMMIYRNDVQEGEPIVNRNVAREDLSKGKTPLYEKVIQDFDRKQLEGDFPLEALAAGKVTLTFTDKAKPHDLKDLSAYIKNQTVTSNTGQLRWDTSGKGYFTVNTPGTKALVGFLPDQWFRMDEIDLRCETPFAVIFVSGMEKDRGIREANQLLITTVARAKNTGMEYNAEHTELIKTGEAPLLMEPVRIELKSQRKEDFIVRVLDHAGTPTGEVLRPVDKTILLDGAQYKTIYYRLEYLP